MKTMFVSMVTISMSLPPQKNLHMLLLMLAFYLVSSLFGLRHCYCNLRNPQVHSYSMTMRISSWIVMALIKLGWSIYVQYIGSTFIAK